MNRNSLLQHGGGCKRPASSKRLIYPKVPFHAPGPHGAVFALASLRYSPFLSPPPLSEVFELPEPADVGDSALAVSLANCRKKFAFTLFPLHLVPPKLSKSSTYTSRK